MEIWHLVAMAASLWTFVSLGVALSLDPIVDPKSWHLRFLRASYDVELSPSTQCRYFWCVLAAPLVCIALYGIAGVIRFVVLFCRTCFDWAIMPLTWKYATGTLTREYWKNLVGIGDNSYRPFAREKKVTYVDLPFRRYGIALMTLLALALWAFVGQGTVRGAMEGDTPTVVGILWVAISFIGVLFFTVLAVNFIFSKTIWFILYKNKRESNPEQGERWSMFWGKFCKTLVYPSTPKAK